MGCLARAGVGLVLLLLAGAAAFGIYAWRVMHSDLMLGLKEGSRAYSCIGSVHDPERPRARPELQIARYYLRDGYKGKAPSPWPVRYALAYWAIGASTSAEQANRLYAAMPMIRSQGFDAVARYHAGKPYCALDAAGKQAVLDFYWNPRRYPIEGTIRPADD